MGKRVFAYVSVGPLLRGRGNKITSFYNIAAAAGESKFDTH